MENSRNLTENLEFSTDFISRANTELNFHFYNIGILIIWLLLSNDLWL